MPAMPAMPRGAFRAMESFGPVRMEVGPEVSQSLQRVRARLDALRPRLERIRTEVPRVRVEFGERGMEL
jgi:hypothetical protein